jgi:transcriptional regulator with XRE-family HTH domain
VSIYRGSKLVQAFAMNLRQLREERGLSQEALAGVAGMDRTYVSSCERGERNATLATVEKLAAALGAAPTALIAQRSE